MLDLYRFKQYVLNENFLFNKSVIKDTANEVIIQAIENMGSYKMKIFISCDCYGLTQVEFVTVPIIKKTPEFFDAEIDLRFYLSRFSDRDNLFMVNSKNINGVNHYSLLFNDSKLRRNIKTSEDACNYVKEAYNCMFYNTSVKGYLNKVVETLR